MVHRAVAEIAIGLGSNVGDRLSNIQGALDRLAVCCELISASSVYETSPMYEEDQASFLNAAVKAKFSGGPLEALMRLKEIEAEIGRKGRQRYGPREIDLDLLAFGSLNLESETLSIRVPHPRTPERLFVLIPLFEIWPELILPGLGSVKELLESAKSRSESVVRVEHAALSLHRQHTRR